MHYIVFNTKNGAHHKNIYWCTLTTKPPGVHKSDKRLDAYSLYNNISVYQLYKHTGDTIVKSTVSLKHNICTSDLNNITAMVLYIHNTHQDVHCNIQYCALNVIYAPGVNYNILSGALNK